MKTAIIAGAILLTSCTVERTVVVEPATTQTETTQPAKQTSSQRERNFLTYLSDTQGLLSMNYDLALEAGYGVCDMADDGASAKDFVDLLERTGTDMPEFLASVIAAALNFLCPEHSRLLDGLNV